MAVLNEWMTVAAVSTHFQVCTRTVRNWLGAISSARRAPESFAD